MFPKNTRLDGLNYRIIKVIKNCMQFKASSEGNEEYYIYRENKRKPPKTFVNHPFLRSFIETTWRKKVSKPK